MRPAAAILIVGAALSFAAHGGDIYFWIDESGRIVRADILAAEKNPPAAAPSGRTGGDDPFPIRKKGPVQEERAVPVSNMRGIIAKRLVESKTQLPHFYLDIEVDAGPMLDLRQQLNVLLAKPDTQRTFYGLK